jgi:TP901 family phage tail tape measure protein
MVLEQTGISILIKAKDAFSSVFNKASLSLKNFQTAALSSAVVGAGIAVGFGKAIKTSIDFESAFTGVRKTVELSEESFTDLEQRFKDITKSAPITFIELSKIGELAGQLGVEGVDNLEKFTKTIADISVTTNLTAEAAATDFARIANVMQEPLENIDRMGSVVVALGNNFATTEAEISTFAQRISGAGKIVGLTTADVFAIGTALSSVGIEAEAGGTAVQTALLKINDSVITGGEKLDIFAETAGLTSNEFSKLWETDAANAFEKFILGLGKQGDNAKSTLDSVGLGGIRTSRSFLSLANAGDLITDTLETSSSAWEENNALSEEANKRYETLQSQIDIAKNKFVLLGDEIGDRLVPFLENYLLPTLDKIIAVWDNMSPKMQDSLLIFAGVTAAVTLLAGAIALVTLVASPWLLIIFAIALGITNLILLIKNWGKVSEWILEKIKPLVDFLKKWFAPEIAILKAGIKALGMMFSWVWENKIKPFWDKFKTLVDWLKTHVLPILEKVAGFAGGAISKVANFREGLGGKISKITNVNDAIIRPNGDIIKTHPNDTLIATQHPGNMGGGITLIIEGNVYGTDPDEMMEAIQNKIDDKIST